MYTYPGAPLSSRCYLYCGLNQQSLRTWKVGSLSLLCPLLLLTGPRTVRPSFDRIRLPYHPYASLFYGKNWQFFPIRWLTGSSRNLRVLLDCGWLASQSANDLYQQLSLEAGDHPPCSLWCTLPHKGGTANTETQGSESRVLNRVRELTRARGSGARARSTTRSYF